MAKKINYELLPGIVIDGGYVMIGAIRLNCFHQTAELDVYYFRNEDARHQRLAPSEHDLHRPLKVRTITTTFQTYQDYIEETGKQLAAAGYRLLHEVPEGAAINPHGLANLFKTGEDV